MAKTLLSIVLRVVVALSTLAAAIVMLFSKAKPNNERSLLSFIEHENFLKWNGYFIAVQFIACVFNVIAIVLPSKSKLWSLIFFLDMIVLLLQLTSWMAILVCFVYMKSENPYAGCSVCNLEHGFCNLILGALIAAGIASFSSFLLHCYSLQKTLNVLLHEDIPN